MRFLEILRRTRLELFAVLAVVCVVVAPAALGARGVGAPLELGKANKVNRTTELNGRVEGPSLRLNNNSAIDSATALGLKVEPGNPPMRVDSSTKVDNLNVDQLDDLDSSSFMRSTTYKSESPIVTGTSLNDGTFIATESCNIGDRLLSGGPANVNPTSDIVESWPVDTLTWQVRIQTNTVADTWNVVILCANQ